MNDDELKRLWQCQNLNVPAKLSPGEQIEKVRKKMKCLDRVLQWDDALDIGGAVVGTPVAVWFIWYYLKAPFLACIGIVILIAGEAFSIWKQRRARRGLPQPPAGAPMMQWLRHELEKVNAECELARTMFWWYLLPFWIGMIIFLWGLGIELPARIGCFAVVTAICIICWRLNQYVLRKHWPPLINELESLLKSDTPE